MEIDLENMLTLPDRCQPASFNKWARNTNVCWALNNGRELVFNPDPEDRVQPPTQSQPIHLGCKSQQKIWEIEQVLAMTEKVTEVSTEAFKANTGGPLISQFQSLN